MIFNPLIIWLLRSPVHGLLSGNTMVVEYTGRKSGQKYSVPVNYLGDGDSLYTISTRDRTWWRSLRQGQVVLRLKGRDVPARTDVMEDPAAVADVLIMAASRSQMYQKALNIGGEPGGSLSRPDALRTAETRVAVCFKLGE